MKLNNEAFKTFIKEIAKIQGETISENDLDEMDEVLEKMETSVTLWIGTDDALPYKATLSLSGKEEKENVEIKFTGETIFKDYDKDQGIAAPSGTVTFEEVMAKVTEAFSSGIDVGELPEVEEVEVDVEAEVDTE